MAHFAKINEQNKVLTVIVVGNNDMLNSDGVETESIGQQFCENSQSWPAHLWIQTSYNTSYNTHNSGDNSKALRGNYAGIGFEWDSVNEIFWPAQPFTSWVKDNSDANWHSPIGDAPAFTEEQNSQILANTHGWFYNWNEENQSWDLVDLGPSGILEV
tara:strand:- start:4 stop:477 length:474 start_codon:yes stop_codon:yes gene_type:complete